MKYLLLPQQAWGSMGIHGFWVVEMKCIVLQVKKNGQNYIFCLVTQRMKSIQSCWWQRVSENSGFGRKQAVAVGNIRGMCFPEVM